MHSTKRLQVPHCSAVMSFKIGNPQTRLQVNSSWGNQVSTRNLTGWRDVLILSSPYTPTWHDLSKLGASQLLLTYAYHAQLLGMQQPHPCPIAFQPLTAFPYLISHMAMKRNYLV